ncbi:MAG: hypothetical protein AAF799_22715 [Myxococcota bacterium]
MADRDGHRPWTPNGTTAVFVGLEHRAQLAFALEPHCSTEGQATSKHCSDRSRLHTKRDSTERQMTANKHCSDRSRLHTKQDSPEGQNDCQQALQRPQSHHTKQDSTERQTTANEHGSDRVVRHRTTYAMESEGDFQQARQLVLVHHPTLLE